LQKKGDDIVQDPAAVADSKDQLPVSGALEKNQLLGALCAIVHTPDGRQAGAACICVVPRRDEQLSSLNEFWRIDRCGNQEHDVIDFTFPRVGCRLRRRENAVPSARLRQDWRT
jgi:hypothetical protein